MTESPKDAVLEGIFGEHDEDVSRDMIVDSYSHR